MTQTNAQVLAAELDWFVEVVTARIDAIFDANHPLDFPTAPHHDPASSYGKLVAEHAFGTSERLILMTVLAAELRPSMLYDFYQRAKELPELGLANGPNRHLFIPTVRTAMFMVGGVDVPQILGGMQYLSPEHPFQSKKILVQERDANRTGWIEARLAMSPDWFYLLTTGKERRPDFGLDFPAKRIKTELEWKDLVLPSKTKAQVREILAWIQHRNGILEEWGMKRILKPGYKALFFGPPGTGKTLTAGLLGRAAGRDVYRIDLSQVVSKYIGETEKNLARVFDGAQDKDWILFFDEADSLFGKRGKVTDARDRYANQEVSYLLQRLEDFSGLCILASNLKSNIDDAFSRRFQSMIYFPMPDATQRQALWEDALPKAAQLEKGASLIELSRKYELAGGSIINVAAYASLMARERGDATIRSEDLLEGIRREYHKEGKVA